MLKDDPMILWILTDGYFYFLCWIVDKPATLGRGGARLFLTPEPAIGGFLLIWLVD